MNPSKQVKTPVADLLDATAAAKALLQSYSAGDFASSAHTHILSDVDELVDALASKYDSSHVGTTANKLVQLTAAAKLPAVDGSLLTNIAPVVADYTALKATTASYVSMESGVFILSLDQVTSQNGGTRILRTDGTYVDRIWDGKTVNADWFPVGGCSWIDGTAYNLTTGNGVLDPADQISAAAYVASDRGIVVGTGEFLLGRAVVLDDRKELTLKSLNLKRANEVSSTTTATVANGATSIPVTSASGFKVGDLVVLTWVAGTYAGYGQNDQSTAVYITGISGNTVTTSAIAKGSSAPDPLPVGSKLIRVHSLVSVGETEAVDAAHFENCLFDGNKASNNCRQWLLNAAVSISATNAPRCTIRYCRFINSPSETIICPNGTTVESCTFDDLEGSFIHLSSSAESGTEVVQTLINNIVGDGVCQTSVTQSGHNEAWITYSSKVFNPVIDNCYVKNGKNAILGVVAGAPLTSQRAAIRNCTFENFERIVYGSTAGSDTRYEGMEVSGCKFINCGDLYLEGNNVYQGEAIYDVRIVNNRFVNSRIYLGSCADVTIAGNRMLFTDSYKAATYNATSDVWTLAGHGYANGEIVYAANHGGALPTNYSATTPYYVIGTTTDTFQLSTSSGGSAVNGTDAGSGTHYIWYSTSTSTSESISAGALTFSSFDRIRIEDNSIELPRVFNPFIQHACILPARYMNRRKNSGGTELGVLYPQQVYISNFRATNARKGLVLEYINTSSNWMFPVYGWFFNDVFVAGPPDSTHTAGGVASWQVEIPPGCIARNIRADSFYVNNSQIPIIVQGMHSTSTVLSSSLGGDLDGWIVVAHPGSFTWSVAVGGENGINNRNVIVTNGRTSAYRDVTYGDPLYNSCEAAVKINSTLLPPLSAFVGGIPAELFENSGQY